ncbi:MAG: transcriptional repressor LexA [Planctomycetota bacterium]
MTQRTEEPLTPRQVQLLRAIAAFRSRDGYSPTIGELGEQLSISRTTAFGHIEQLRRKGLVSHLPKAARSLTLTSKARRLLSRLTGHTCETAGEKTEGIPLAGTVAAGQPIEAVENKESISMTSYFGTGDDVFALEVRGDSMVGENIREGDYIICRRATAATDGQLVVAIVDNENATLKRFYRESPSSPSASDSAEAMPDKPPRRGWRARLQPANEDYEPIYTNNCRIEGVVIGLVRKL